MTGISPGDAVYGLIDFPRDESAAEFVAVPAAHLVPKLGALDHVRAAAVPLSALTAWQALFDHAGLAPGQRSWSTARPAESARSLSNWRRRGAQVSGTASAVDGDFIRALGVETVIDHRAARFEDRFGTWM